MKKSIKADKIKFADKIRLSGKKIKMMPQISLLTQKKEDTDERLPEHR